MGGGGNDVLTGGAGADRFDFTTPNTGPVHITDFNLTADAMEFKVGANNFLIGNNNTTLDNFHIGDSSAINHAGTELGIKTDKGVATANIQSTIDSFNNITTGALFELFDTSKGHAVVYYDPNPHVAGGATLVAELDSVTNFSDLQKVTVSDFHLI
jgi:hypothetical protein